MPKKNNISMATKLNTETKFFTLESAEGFTLESGEVLPKLTLAYELYGTLNTQANNAILVFHAMTGSHHAAGYNKSHAAISPYWTEDCFLGWWDGFIGSGKALDTTRYCVICVNYLGGCYGSTGPLSVNPTTGQPYNSAFPKITVNDVVDSQLLILDYFKINTLLAVVGASTGGLMAINFSVRYPDRVKKVIPIAASLGVSTLQKLNIIEQIYAIENHNDHSDRGDSEGAGVAERNDNTQSIDRQKNRGMLLARMIAHKTFVSLTTIDKRANDNINQTHSALQFHQPNTAVESYMLHQAHKFVKRFNPHSYLRILELWLEYDILKNAGIESCDELFARCTNQQYLIFSISSDVCFYPEQQQAIHLQLEQTGVSSTYITVYSHKGHDSFLLEPHLFAPYIQYLLDN